MIYSKLILAVAVTRVLIGFHREGIKHFNKHLNFYKACVAFSVALPIFSASISLYSYLQTIHEVTPTTNLILITWVIGAFGSYLGLKLVNNLLEAIAAVTKIDEVE